jgi:hypothetical protein
MICEIFFCRSRQKHLFVAMVRPVIETVGFSIVVRRLSAGGFSQASESS